MKKSQSMPTPLVPDDEQSETIFIGARIPRKLRDMLYADAEQNLRSVSAQIEYILSLHYAYHIAIESTDRTNKEKPQ